MSFLPAVPVVVVDDVFCWRMRSKYASPAFLRRSLLSCSVGVVDLLEIVSSTADMV